MKKYEVTIEHERLGKKESAYLYVSHHGNAKTGIRMNDPKHEIPVLIEALSNYLTTLEGTT